MQTRKINLVICTAGEAYGGIEQFIYSYSESLKEQNTINFIVILFNKGLLYERLSNLGIKLYVIETKFKYNLFCLKKIVRIFKNQKINLIHTHGYKANILCSIAAQFCRIKVLKTEHGILEPTKGLRLFKMSLNLLADKLISKQFLSGIVFVSNDIKSVFHITYSKLAQYVIYNGIVPVKISETCNIAIEKNYFNIGIIGRISEVKGHIFLLRAMKNLTHLNNIRLYIIGEGPLEEMYKNYCHINGLSKKVVFMGFQINIYEFMRSLDLLIMPSLREGLPYTLLEAMYLKVPVIASSVGGVKEVLTNDYDGVLIPQKDHNILAEKIEEMYQNPEKRGYIANNAYSKVNSTFLAEKMVENYLRAYNEILI